MNAIKARVQAGRVEATAPPEWPEGTEVEIQPVHPVAGDDQEGPMPPEEIARTLAAMEKVEPYDLTEAEASALDVWERKVEEYTIANMDKGIEDVFL